MTNQEKKYLSNIIREAIFVIIWTIVIFFNEFILLYIWTTIIWYAAYILLIFAFEFNIYKFINYKNKGEDNGEKQ